MNSCGMSLSLMQKYSGRSSEVWRLKFFMSNVTNLAPLRERMLLRRSLTISKDTILVPTLLGYLIF